jgi:hypothetical protein
VNSDCTVERTVALYKRSLKLSEKLRKARNHIVLGKRARDRGDLIEAAAELNTAEAMLDRIEGLSNDRI